MEPNYKPPVYDEEVGADTDLTKVENIEVEIIKIVIQLMRRKKPLFGPEEAFDEDEYYDEKVEIESSVKGINKV